MFDRIIVKVFKLVLSFFTYVMTLLDKPNWASKSFNYITIATSKVSWTLKMPIVIWCDSHFQWCIWKQKQKYETHLLTSRDKKMATNVVASTRGTKKWCSMLLLTMLGTTLLRSCHLFAHNHIVKGLTL
jgi:hypothetical protein